MKTSKLLVVSLIALSLGSTISLTASDDGADASVAAATPDNQQGFFASIQERVQSILDRLPASTLAKTAAGTLVAAALVSALLKYIYAGARPDPVFAQRLLDRLVAKGIAVPTSLRRMYPGVPGGQPE